MRSFRSKPVGWRNESYRHSLAARGYTAKKLKGYEQAQLRRIRGEIKEDDFDELLKGKEVKKQQKFTSTGQPITQMKTELPENIEWLSKTARVKRVKKENVIGEGEEEEFDPEKFIEEQLNIQQEQPDFIRKSEAIKMMIEKRVAEQKKKEQEEREYELKEKEKQVKESERKKKAQQQLEEFMKQFDEKEI